MANLERPMPAVGPTDWNNDTTWTIRRDGLPSSQVLHQETLFTTGNGNFSLRGGFEEGHDGEDAASFMHRVWDDHPEHLTELANLPRWWGLELWLDGQPVRYDTSLATGLERSLDLRSGLLSRSYPWRGNAGAPVLTVRYERFLSMAEPHGAMLRTRVELAAGTAELRLRVALGDGSAATEDSHWRLTEQASAASALELVSTTRHTGIPLAVVVRPQLSVAAQTVISHAGELPFVEYRLALRAGEPVELVRSVAVVPGLDSDSPLAVAREVSAALDAAGWEASLTASSDVWQGIWADSFVEIEGDPEAQLAVRYNQFQLIVAAPRFTEDASIGAKTLSGYGYRHHVFWDTEVFMVPHFTFTDPQVARNMLSYRCRRLAGAREKAAANGYAGAQFPWESADTGREVTPTWVRHYADPSGFVRIWTGDIEIHITADLAYAVLQYWRVTGDDAFLRDQGAELVLEGAQFWASAAVAESDGQLHLRGVIGPDEYHEHVDDNAYTNYLAAWHLRTAAQLLSWLERTAPRRAADLAARLGIDEATRARWIAVADQLYLPLHAATGLVEQFRGYFSLIDVDREVLRDPSRRLSMQQLLGIDGCNLTQHVKQPDVLMLAYLLPDLFTAEQLATNYHYYDPRTDHEQGSSLGPAISAAIACRAGDTERAYEHFLRAARADLLDLRGNTADGIHGASAGGLWQAVVLGFAGLRITDDGWSLSPSLPSHWRRLRFCFRCRGQRHVAEVLAGVGH